MFCPLCKVEFRQGFTTCSDCHIALVATTKEAAAVAVGRLWTGDESKRVEGILEVLAEAEIRFHSKEVKKSGIWSWVSIPLAGFLVLLGFHAKPHPMFEFHIDVFEKDMARAKEMVEAIEKAESVDLDDEE